MSNPQVGEGNVTITIGDEEMVLKPSYNAARTLSQIAGGLQAAMDRVIKLDVDLTVQIISLGLGNPAGKIPKDLGEKVWASGFLDDGGGLLQPVIQYIRVLLNGGRALKEQEQEAEAAANPQTR